MEFARVGLEHPDYYDEAHQHIIERLLELKQSKNK
jgi:hypothetical protein